MKLKDILRLIPGSQRVSIIIDEETIYDGWELFNAWKKFDRFGEDILNMVVVRIDTIQDKLQIRVLKD